MLDLIPSWILGPLLRAVQQWTWLSRKLNAYVINLAVNAFPHRPHPWSTFCDYVCWTSLSDQRWSARHLPPKLLQSQPDAGEVVALFQRPDNQQRFCEKSTCLFPAFAQYLTDGFIRTLMPRPGQPDSLRRENTSNHQIDMCALYGRTEEQTAALRLKNTTAGQRGRLKSQSLHGEEYSPFLYGPDGKVRPEFECLDAPLGVFTNVTTPEQLGHLFATGGDRVNGAPQIAMINTLFLREHNRLAGELERRNPSWDDEHVFQVARNIVIVMFIKIVVEDYINHITPYPFRLSADPAVAWNAPWNKPNWITTEFSLLYRWHSLIPDEMVWGGKSYPVGTTLLENRILIETGLGQSFKDMSSQKAGKLGALNTAQALLTFELNAIKQGRVCSVAPYIDYRRYANLPVPTKFEDVSSNPAIVDLLRKIYARVEDIDFYVGLFAEDTVPNSPLPRLILSMVAVDAFSQALTNPLLSEHAFNPGTFTEFGWKTIQSTGTLHDIVVRHCAIGDARISMTQADWRYH